LAGKSKLVQIDYSSVYTHDLCYFLTNLQVLQRKKKEKKTIKEKNYTNNQRNAVLVNKLYLQGNFKKW